MMLKGVLEVERRPVADATSVYPVPTLSILSDEKVETPDTAFTTVVPDSVPGTGVPALLPIAIVMLEVKVVTTFPSESTAASLIAGLMVVAVCCGLEGWIV